MYDSTVKPEEAEYNRIDFSNKHIYITNLINGRALFNGNFNGISIPFTKYDIKETDFRVKTASFTTPLAIDLTQGVILCKIVSTDHENFTGMIIVDDYPQNSDGTYTYQCQDMSRQYMGKLSLVSKGKSNYRILQSLLTRFGIGINDPITAEKKSTWKSVLSGLRPLGKYEGKLYDNPIGINMMAQKPNLIIRNKTYMEAIRDICHANGYVDVYFNEKGILQIEPIAIKDWKNTGLWLTTNEVISRDFKFDTTNMISEVVIESTNNLKAGKSYSSKNAIGLDLSVFFGFMSDSSSNPNQGVTTTIKSDKKTTTSAKKTASKANPYNNKSKKILLSADGGSASFKNSIEKLLKNDGWKVTDLGVGPGTHSTAYNKLSKNYAVNLTIYNGADPATIAEPVTGWLKGKHEKYGVQLVQLFDSSSWTNPKGMKPYRYGDFNGYHCKKAWDDNYSSGKVDIKNLGAWYKKYRKKVLHCAGPSAKEAYAQFKVGGYLKSKGL